MASVAAEEDIFAAGDGGAEPAAADELSRGSLHFRLVPFDQPTQSVKQFWRSYGNSTAALTIPKIVYLDGKPLIAPRASVVKETKEATTLYPSDARTDIADGAHEITPGALRLTMAGGKLSSTNPAIKIDGSTINILCAAVRFEAVDATGAGVPLALKLSWEKEALLRDAPHFNPLIIWLPLGAKYTSSLGVFSIGADGKIAAEAKDLAPGVALTPEGLRQVVEPKKPAARREPNARVKEWSREQLSLNYYHEPLVKPGDAARIAFSKKKYQAQMKTSFSLDNFARFNSVTQTWHPISAAEAAPPADNVCAEVAQKLETEPADLAWVGVPVSKTAPGGVFNLTLKDGKLLYLSLSFVIADAGAPLQLIPHRLRTVFSNHEEAPFAIVIRPGTAGGEAKVLCQPVAPADAKPLELAKLALPAVPSEKFDSRAFKVRTRDIPPGDHWLWVEAGAAVSPRVAFSVVNWERRSPFLVHAMAACGGMWSDEDDGLKLLQDAGYEMLAHGGHASRLSSEVPTLNPAVASWLAREPGLPQELAAERTYNDDLLERMTRHGIRLLDYYPRAHNMYNEGLTYHHSYKPAVDRMVRRMQIFTQQTLDYPSFWGLHYSWYPNMFGYVEGGVDTDAMKHLCNKAVGEALNKAGFRGITKEEEKQYHADKFSADPAKKSKALELMRMRIARWQATFEFGFGKHNKIYNDSVREIKPDAAHALFENAGHDSGKWQRQLYGDMTALSYESYSDYPEWPMSASFSTDWARGNVPEKPVWISMDPGSTSEGMMKSLFHAFGRGLHGGGPLMPAEQTVEELRRRGKGVNAVSQYGAIPTRAIPDNRVAILATLSERCFGKLQTQYVYHAVYYHLTRLGYPAVILEESNLLAGGIPKGVKIIVLAHQQQPLEPQIEQKLEDFINAGGQVLATADTLVKVRGAQPINAKVRTIWELGGFVSHPQLWEEFEKNWIAPLSEAMAKTNVPPAAKVDPFNGLAVCLDAGEIRYAVVLPEEKGQPFSVFKPKAALPVSFEGAGWTVRDLLRQANVKTEEKDGRTHVAIDLVTEPVALLALYKTPPASVELRQRGEAKLGGEIVFSSNVGDGKTSLGPVPVKLTVADPAGKIRMTVFRAAGDELKFPLPALDQGGVWKIAAQELLTGITASAEISAAPAPASPSAVAVGDVHAVNEVHLRNFFQKPGTKYIIVEAGQSSLLPLAQKTAEQLAAAGVAVKVWQARPEDFDSIPLRWHPRVDEDWPRLKEIDACTLIGFRQHLNAWIDPQTRLHVPDRGGYGEVGPHFMLNADCIVFSGGAMAASLAGVTPWMNTPNVPGIGQGRLVVTFSSFSAGRSALAVIANDADGMAKAAAALATYVPPAKPEAPAPAGEWKTLASKSEVTPVPQTFPGYTPVRRVKRLLATREGKAAVYLNGNQDTLAFIDAAGKVTGTVVSEPKSTLPYVRIDSEGCCWELVDRHLGGEWYNQEVSLRCVGPDGLRKEVQAHRGSVFFDTLPTNWQGGFPVSPDGSFALGLRGGFWLGKPGAGNWLRFDDQPYHREGYRHPRFPIGGQFSPDSRYLLLTMDTRPPGWGNMNWPATVPCISDTLLIDAATAKPVWRLSDGKVRNTRYVAHTGFAAVSNDGALTAISDYHGYLMLVDKSGKIVLEQQVSKLPSRYETGPVDGVGTWLSDDGKLAAFGFKNTLWLSQGSKASPVQCSFMTSGGVTPEGAFAAIGQENGEVRAFNPDGTVKWTAKPGGIAPLVTCIAGNQVLAATSTGELVTFDADGREVRRTGVAAAADKQRTELKPAADFQKITRPREYIEPRTLEIAKNDLGAKQLWAWTPAGDAQDFAGKKFHAVAQPVVASAASPTGECFLHLVYRRPAQNKSLKIIVDGKEPETFILDCATPEYRVIDIPIKGAAPKATIAMDGAVEIAECSLWGFQWPGPNLALVSSGKQAGGLDDSGGLDDAAKADDALMELEGTGGVLGKMKDCKIWCPNEDIDKIAGQFLKPGVDPLRMVDGRRFGNGKVPAWASVRFVGTWFVIDFSKPLPLKLVATYDRAQQQSQLSASIAVFSTEKEKETVLAGVINNDQFWRIFPVRGNTQQLGVHIMPAGKTEGLSEIEAYQALK